MYLATIRNIRKDAPINIVCQFHCMDKGSMNCFRSGIIVIFRQEKSSDQ
jgi:hypothetical protein